MLQCSLGNLETTVVRRALSGYTFVEFTIPVDAYTDSPKFTLTIGNLESEYRMVGSEVYMHPGDRTVVRVSGMLGSQEKWLSARPRSVESSKASELLKGMGISNGPDVPVTLLNLALNDGQLAILLANMSPKTALVDFEDNTVKYYSELYRQRPVQVKTPFRRLYGRAPVAGYIGWDTSVTGAYPDDTQATLPFGQSVNMDGSLLKNALDNCNALARAFSDMQMFTYPQELGLGTTVASELTYDKKVIVAAEEHYDANSNVSAVYYCI